MYNLRKLDPRKIRKATKRFFKDYDGDVSIDYGYLDTDYEPVVDIPVVPCYDGDAQKRIIPGGIVLSPKSGELFRLVDVEWADPDTPISYLLVNLRTRREYETTNPGEFFYLPKLWLKYLEEELGIGQIKEKTYSNHPTCPICGGPQTTFRGAPACERCNIFHNIGESGNGLWLRIGTMELAYDPKEEEDIPF